MKDWLVQLTTIINLMTPSFTQEWKKTNSEGPLEKARRIKYFSQSDLFDPTPYLYETDSSGDTLVHVVIRELHTNTTKPPSSSRGEIDLTDEILAAILMKLQLRGGNFFMPNNAGVTPYAIINSKSLVGNSILEALYQSHIDSQNKERRIYDLRKINELVIIKGPLLTAALEKFLNSFQSVSDGLAYLYRPVLRLSLNSEFITPIDLLTRAAAKYPSKYAIIHAIELKRKALKNPPQTMPVPNEVNNTLAIQIIYENDNSGLAHHTSLIRWGQTQSQNKCMYRLQQQKIASILQSLEGIEHIDSDWKRNSQISLFIKSFFALLNQETEDGKIMAYEFSIYTRHVFGISQSSIECLHQAYRAFINPDAITIVYSETNKSILTNDQKKPFLNTQILALNAMAKFAGWGERYFDKYEPENMAKFCN